MSATPEQIAELCERLRTELTGYEGLLFEAANALTAQAERVRVLESALKFYADKDNHKMRREPSYRDRFSQNMKPGKLKLGRVSEDKGQRARAALKAAP